VFGFLEDETSWDVLMNWQQESAIAAFINDRELSGLGEVG